MGKHCNYPKSDIEALDINLRKAREQHVKTARELGFQIEAVEAIKPFWSDISPDMIKGSLSSGASMLAGWRKQSESWVQTSDELGREIGLISGTASVLVSSTATLSDLYSPVQYVDSEKIRRLTEQRDERNLVRDELRIIDPALGDTYATIWQYMDLPAFDLVRGPLFLMRQVFDHFLEKIAPDELVASQPGFVPDQKVKNAKGITRRHRIEFMAKTRGREIGSIDMLLQSTQNFLDVYQELNEAHKRRRLQEDTAKDAVYAGSALLSTWLKAIR